MQAYSAVISDQVWSKLEQIFLKYTNGQKTISQKQLESLTKEVLREESEAEVAYLVRNLNRIDVDNSGTVDFQEFANFLLKRHCGEMALQRMHRSKLIRNSGLHKITLEEFRKLLHEAYRFLGVTVDETTARKVFEQADTDRDGLITYVEYFKFIENAICRTNTTTTKTAQSKQKQAKNLSIAPVGEDPALINFRRLLWGELLRIYIKYDSDGNGNMDDGEFTLLLKELLNETSQSALDYVFKNAFRMDINNDSWFVFDEFAQFFIKHTAEIGLDRFNRSRNASGKRDINSDQFIVLFGKSFGFLHTLNLTEGDIRRIFSRIDKDNDGIISYRDYLQWTLELLTFRESNGIPCYFETSTGFESQVIVAPVQVPVEIPVHKPTVVSVRWNFTSRALADAAKQQALRILLGFDANANKIVDSEEIREILRILLKENSLEIDYVLVNFFRYTHGRKSVTFEEFVEFFLGLHCTELTIQRLHREGAFSRGDERIISEAEFIRALVLALSAIKYTASEGDIRQLFRDINTSRNGWISYQSFFEALKEYFGYKLESNLVIYRRTSFINNSTVVAVKQAAPRPVQVVAEPKQEIQDEFGSWIRTITISILSRYDFNKNYEFERDEIIAILRDVFNESPTEIDYVLLNMFRYDTNGDKSVSYDELTNFILEIHCGEIALQRLHKEKKFAQWQKRMLASIDFILSMRTAFAFLKVELKTEDLQRIFAFIDTDRDGLISYGEYFGFIRNYLGSKRKITEPIQLPDIPTVKKFESIEQEVGDTIRNRVLKLLSEYDLNKNLRFEKNEIINLLIEVFHEEQTQIDYVVLNYSRYDVDGDGIVTYDELANFILDIHCGEIALQRLHRNKRFVRWEQRVLNQDEYLLAMKESFAFLGSVFNDQDLRQIFQGLDKDRSGFISYSKYFEFIRDYMGSKMGSKIKSTATTVTTSTKSITTSGLTSASTFSGYDTKLSGSNQYVASRIGY